MKNDFPHMRDRFNESEFGKVVIGGWRPKLPEFFRSQYPSLCLTIEACWHKNPDERPDFAEVADFFASWDGEASTTPDHRMMVPTYVRHRHLTEAYSPQELSFLTHGANLIMEKVGRRRELQRFDKGFASSVVTRTMPFNAAEVAEFVFDWEHEEKFVKGYYEGEQARKTINRINDHHHICWGRVGFPLPGVKPRDVLCRSMWREMSQGNFIVVNKTDHQIPIKLPDSENTIQADIYFILLARQSLHSNSCECTSLLNVDLKGVFSAEVLKSVIGARSMYLFSVEMSLKRIQEGVAGDRRDGGLNFYVRPSPLLLLLQNLANTQMRRMRRRD
jgi:hypothetical protein